MKNISFIISLAVAMLAVAGCQTAQKNDSDAIRQGIELHLSSLKTLNLSAMEMKVTNVSLNGNTAEAQVEYSPKNGAPAGAAMKVSYTLEKRGGTWIVVRTNAVGGAIDHPASGANPHAPQPQGAVHGNLPNFRELVAPAQSGQQAAPASSDAVSSSENKPNW